MTRLRIFALAMLVTLPAFGADPRLGIDRAKLSTQSADVRDRTLAGIHTLGAGWFRDTYVSWAPHGLADWVDELREVKRQNLKFLETVLPVDSDFDKSAVENAGEAFKKRCGWQQGSRKLSRINLDKFAERLRTEFDALKSAEVTVDAFEIGNEFDWICFNGDVPDGHDASQDEFMTAVRAYAHYLKAAVEVIHDPRYYPNATIITFPLANIDDNWDRGMHHFRNPTRLITQLKDVDGFNYLDNSSYHVDAYGVHLYPAPDAVRQDTRDTLRRDATGLGSDRPLWVTEWGLDPARFPNKGGESRAEAAAEFYSTIRGFRGASFGPIFYYSYDTGLTDSSGNLLPDAKAMLRVQ